jgi:hypothetical protein
MVYVIWNIVFSMCVASGYWLLATGYWHLACIISIWHKHAAMLVHGTQCTTLDHVNLHLLYIL